MRFSVIRFRTSRNKPCRNHCESLDGNFSDAFRTAPRTYMQPHIRCYPVKDQKSGRSEYARALQQARGTSRYNGSLFGCTRFRGMTLSICRKWIVYAPRFKDDFPTIETSRDVVHEQLSSILGTIRRISRTCSLYHDTSTDICMRWEDRMRE